jgi:hypothetical protein
MSELADTVARAVALEVGAPVATRRTYALARDPSPVFGIAPIRVVSEQRVQAVAFGDLDSRPQLVTIWNPLSRDTGELEPFAASLHAYVADALAAERIPRIWLPHGAALEILDVLGHRYRTNQQASATMRRLGSYCRAFAEEAQYAGQQAVAIAAALLATHVVTGQSAIEDRHLGALLAWFESRPGSDPLAESRRRAMIPAAAMLDRNADDQVEALRMIAKKGGPAGAAARRQVELLLQVGAMREWDLLRRGRQAYWGLGLEFGRTTRLAASSRERLAFSLEHALNPPSRAHSLGRLLDSYEHAREVSEHAELLSDETARARARGRGRVLATRVIRVDQTTRGRRPCTLEVRTAQQVLRVRRGTRLQSVDGSLDARVMSVADGRAGHTVIELRLERGFRSVPGVGAEIEWLDVVPFGGMRHKNLVYSIMQRADHPAVYGEVLPAERPRQIAAANLLGLAEASRRRQ